MVMPSPRPVLLVLTTFSGHVNTGPGAGTNWHDTFGVAAESTVEELGHQLDELVAVQ
jgi:hypothetical protein